jgi:hypothetical protein
MNMGMGDVFACWTRTIPAVRSNVNLSKVCLPVVTDQAC